MPKNTFFQELKRRNVYRVAIAYAATAWLLAQIASIVIPTFHAADWIMKLILIVLAIGFPVSLFIAWVYEISAEGLKKTEAIPKNESITVKTGKKLNIVIIGILLLAVVLLLTDKMTGNVRGVAGISPLLPSSSLPGAFKNQRVAVIPFDNQTNSDDLESFGLWASDHITSQLSILDNVKIVSSTNVQNNIQLASLGNKTSDAFTNATGAEIVIQGRYYIQENNLILHTNVVEALTGEVIHVFKALRGDRGNPEGLLEKLGELILGYWAVKDKAKFKKRPPNYKAYQYYLRGSEIWESDYDEAERLLIKAIELDSTFYIAMMKLVPLYDNTRQLDLMVQMHNYLKDNSHNFTPWEKARFGGKPGDRIAAADARMQLYEIDPFDYVSNISAAQGQTQSLNNPRRALEILANYPYPYQEPSRSYNNRILSWMRAYYVLGDYEKVLSVLDSVTIRNYSPSGTDLHVSALVRLGLEDELKIAVDYYSNHVNELANRDNNLGWIFNSICDEAKIMGMESLVHAYATRLIDWCHENSENDESEFLLGMAYYWMEDYEKALLHFASFKTREWPNEFIHRFYQRSVLGMMGICYGILNQYVLAEECIDTIEEKMGPRLGLLRWDLDENIALIYAHMEEKDKAIVYLKKYINGLDNPFGHGLNFDARFMPLFGYPPFEELVKIVE